MPLSTEYLVLCTCPKEPAPSPQPFLRAMGQRLRSLRVGPEAVAQQQALDLSGRSTQVEQRLQIGLVVLRIRPLSVEQIEKREFASRIAAAHELQGSFRCRQNRLAIAADAVGGAGVSLVDRGQAVLQVEFDLLHGPFGGGQLGLGLTDAALIAVDQRQRQQRLDDAVGLSIDPLVLHYAALKSEVRNRLSAGPHQRCSRPVEVCLREANFGANRKEATKHVV